MLVYYLKKLTLLGMISSFLLSNAYAEYNKNEALIVVDSKDNVDQICKKKSVREIFYETPLRKIALRYAIAFGVSTMVYCGAKALNEWIKGRILTETEKELLWHESILSFVLAQLCMSDLECSSSSNENAKEKQDSTAGQAC